MGILVRRLGPGDEPVMAMLAVATDFDLPGLGEPEEPLSPERAAEFFADPNVVYWVAEDGAEVVGELLCHILRLPTGPGRELLLYSIGVREAWRRRGVGRALVAEMLAFMRETDIDLVWLLADNPGAERFYEACGFTRGGEHDQGVLYELTLLPSRSGPAV